MALDDLRAGALARAVRHRLGWTQAELGRRAGVSQKLVSLFECGRLDELTVRSVRLVARTLEIQMPFAPRWRGGDGARLLDGDHAALVNQVVAVLTAANWAPVVEYSFNHYGERGSVDVVAWHEATRSLLLVEVKSRLLDTQSTMATLDRKVRIVPQLLQRDRGWRAAGIGVVLALEELSSNRAAVARTAATFDAAFPNRGREIRRWIRSPAAALNGLWYLVPRNLATGKRVPTSRKRIRSPNPRSAHAEPAA